MVFTLDSGLTFGKYKGQTVKDVCDDNPEYIEWANDEIVWFELSSEAEDYLAECLFNLGPDGISHEHYVRYGEL